MVEDKYKLAKKTDTELHAWLIKHKPGTDEYVAGIRESTKRLAILEEVIEKEEEPVLRREKIAIFVAFIAIVGVIVTVVLTY